MSNQEVRVKNTMETKASTIWHGVRIGAIVGFISIILLGLYAAIGGPFNGICFIVVDCFANPYFIIMLIMASPALPGGMIGAVIGVFIGRKLKHSETAAWIGALTGAILGASYLIVILISLANGGTPFD